MSESPFDDDLVSVYVGLEGVISEVGEDDAHFRNVCPGFDEVLDGGTSRRIARSSSQTDLFIQSR